MNSSFHFLICAIAAVLVVSEEGMAGIEDLHGGTPETATVLEIDAPGIDAVVNSEEDVDLFTFDATAGTGYLLGRRLGARAGEKGESYDTLYFKLVDTDGTTVLTNTPSLSEGQLWICTVSGRYYLRVDGQDMYWVVERYKMGVQKLGEGFTEVESDPDINGVWELLAGADSTTSGTLKFDDGHLEITLVESYAKGTSGDPIPTNTTSIAGTYRVFEGAGVRRMQMLWDKHDETFEVGEDLRITVHHLGDGGLQNTIGVYEVDGSNIAFCFLQAETMLENVAELTVDDLCNSNGLAHWQLAIGPGVGCATTGDMSSSIDDLAVIGVLLLLLVLYSVGQAALRRDLASRSRSIRSSDAGA
ncbi:MAG: hypothetical protein HYV27_13080 [Candidatus Hydrogenedentes bacterium]|nr:hypothetical protein [Candidatus Hydrogenedentota bacterium]